MRKAAVIFLSLMLALGLVGCGNSGQNGETSSVDITDDNTEKVTEATETEEETIAETTDETTEVFEEETMEEITGETDEARVQTTEETESSGGKTLVVYYSATGSTEAVAQTIAETTGGDLFELVPVELYSNDDLDWTNGNSRVSIEYANEDQREIELVSVTVDNWDEYDTVFIGYPIWWGNAAWPVNEFIETNDFSGKTVIPFCTSSSSGLGESGERLEEMAGTGDWQEGMRFRSSVSADQVTAWVTELGLAE